MTDVQLKTNEPTPLSSRFNWPLLSSRKSDVQLKTDEPTFFSSQFNWPLLSGRKGNVELMSDNPTPFSKQFGWQLLSDKPTMFDTQLSTSSGGSASTGDSPFSKFLRGIMSGEVQK